MKNLFFLLLLIVSSARAGVPYILNYSPSTNLGFYVTNRTIVTTSDDTNHLYVSSAGTAGANGRYTFKSHTTFTIWTNTAGTFGILNDPAFPTFSDEWALTNSAGTEQYFANAITVNPWTVTGGAGPGPAVKYGTNYTTNVSVQTIARPYNLPQPVVQQNIWYVRTNGNDIFALRGRQDYPKRTIYSACSSATNGDVVMIGPGTFDETNWVNIQLPPNLCITGSGRRLTYIVGTCGTTCLEFQLGNSNYIGNFSGTNVWIYEGVGTAVTNCIVENVEISAPSDIIVFDVSGSWNPVVRDCELIGNSDKIADFSESLPNAWSNSTITVMNTRVSANEGSNGKGFRTAKMGWRASGFLIDVTTNNNTFHTVSNTATAGGYVFAPLTIATNFISGFVYSNPLTCPVWIAGASVAYTEAVVTGRSSLEVRVTGTIPSTITYSKFTALTTIAGSDTNGIAAVLVGPGGTYTFTNTSTGAGNITTVSGGQIYVP